MVLDNEEIDRRLAHYQAVAKRAGIKLTPQRLEIFRIVAASEEHPSAEVVHQAVRARMPMVSLDTVYRTLWLLTDLGLLTMLGPRQGSVRFDANLEQHHHYLCTRCGRVLDFESAEFNALRIPERVKDFGQILSAHVEVRGICAACARAAADADPNTAPPERGDDNE
ncbi:MAG: transcriptional repressor [Candidatus Competibacteraceae bacterium]|nr:transcriptional repressor [Candidatus Competibacteraceae bacterium]